MRLVYDAVLSAAPDSNCCCCCCIRMPSRILLMTWAKTAFHASSTSSVYNWEPRLCRRLCWTIGQNSWQQARTSCGLITSGWLGNNNNSNNSKKMFMVLSSWQSHCESSPGSFDECRTAPSGRRPKTKPDDLGCESACTGCQSPHPPSPFIIIAQPESWYSFYRPTEGRRLSQISQTGNWIPAMCQKDTLIRNHIIIYRIAL